jgi:hypothetical protein
MRINPVDTELSGISLILKEMCSKAMPMIGMELNFILGFSRPHCEEDIIM